MLTMYTIRIISSKKKHPDPQIPSSPKKKENKGINQRPFEIRNNNNDTYYQK